MYTINLLFKNFVMKKWFGKKEIIQIKKKTTQRWGLTLKSLYLSKM